MNLILEQYFVFEPDKELDCEASKVFFERRDKDCRFSFSDVCAIFYARHRRIYEGEEAVYIEVREQETQELFSLTARKGMHEVMLKHNLYPPIIMNALKK